jgi:hypothetical protein
VDVDLAEDDKIEIELNRNVRRSFRKQIVAMVSRIGQTGLKQWIGVVGDIGIEGFRMIQDFHRVEYKQGSRHRIEISPMKKSPLQKFLVDCEVRWIDPKTHAIGFQFLEMSAINTRMLKNYLESLDKSTPGLS